MGDEGDKDLSLGKVNGMGVECGVLASCAQATSGLVLRCQLFLGATVMKCSNSANCGESMVLITLTQ
jgi:hypothetical protein